MSQSPSGELAPSVQDLAEMAVPKKNYAIPEFLVHSRSKQMNWQTDVEKAMAQAKALTMQAYALAWIELFDDYPNLQLVDTLVSEDGFIALTNAEGEDTADLDGDMEYINDKRDSSILPFILELTEDDQLERESLEDVIEQAYDTQAKLLDVATWQEVSAKRRALLEDLRLEQQTAPAPSTRAGGPRL